MSLRSIALSSLRTAERLLRGRTSASALASVDEFLILFYDQAFGTAVHATPIFEALRQARPNARITVASCGIARETLRNSPFPNRVIETPNPYTHTLAAARVIRREFRPGKLFCIITPAGSSRSRISLLAVLAGKALRIGYTLMPEFYDAPLSPSACDDSQIARNLRTLLPLGIQSAVLEPRLYFTATDVQHAQALLADSPVGTPAAGTAILVTRTSGGQLTAWPDDRFIAVARHLIDVHKLRVLLPGTGADAAPVASLVSSMDAGAYSVAGKTTVPQLAALCALADIAVTLDTGTLHVARTQALPLAVIAPAWQASIEWMPLGKPWARILKGPWFPAPPPPGYAMQEVGVADVIAAVDDLLTAFPATPSARESRVRHSLVAAERIE